VASCAMLLDHAFAVIPAMVTLLTMNVLSKARFDSPPHRNKFNG
jgi:hypothetical protein